MFRITKFLWLDHFIMLKYTSCLNFVRKYWILRKLCQFPFLPIWHWPGFTKIAVKTFQEKVATFEVKQLEPSNFAILCRIWYTYYRGSRKIFWMCKIENAEGDATRDRVMVKGIYINFCVTHSPKKWFFPRSWFS